MDKGWIRTTPEDWTDGARRKPKPGTFVAG
jgi:hypothetical protein